MPPAVPLKQVTKFFILESSRKSCRQKGQWTVSPGKQALSPVLRRCSCFPVYRVQGACGRALQTLLTPTYAFPALHPCFPHF